MALPYTFSSPNTYPEFGAVKNGPFYYNNNIYVITYNSTSHVVCMYMSTDGGNTWNEQDSAHHPSCNSSTANYAVGGTGFLSGSTLWVAYYASASQGSNRSAV